MSIAFDKAVSPVEISTNVCGVEIHLIAMHVCQANAPFHQKVAHSPPPRIGMREESVKVCDLWSAYFPRPSLSSFLFSILTNMGLAHRPGPGLHELVHKRSRNVPFLARWVPRKDRHHVLAVVSVKLRVRVQVEDVPMRPAQDPAGVIRVDDLDPARCRVGTVPYSLAQYSGMDGGFSAGLWGKEEVEVLVGRGVVGCELAADEGVELGVGLELQEFERHGDGRRWFYGCFGSCVKSLNFNRVLEY